MINITMSTAIIKGSDVTYSCYSVGKDLTELLSQFRDHIAEHIAKGLTHSHYHRDREQKNSQNA